MHLKLYICLAFCTALCLSAPVPNHNEEDDFVMVEELDMNPAGIENEESKWTSVFPPTESEKIQDRDEVVSPLTEVDLVEELTDPQDSDGESVKANENIETADVSFDGRSLMSSQDIVPVQVQYKHFVHPTGYNSGQSTHSFVGQVKLKTAVEASQSPSAVVTAEADVSSAIGNVNGMGYVGESSLSAPKKRSVPERLHVKEDGQTAKKPQDSSPAASAEVEDEQAIFRKVLDYMGRLWNGRHKFSLDKPNERTRRLGATFIMITEILRARGNNKPILEQFAAEIERVEWLLEKAHLVKIFGDWLQEPIAQEKQSAETSQNQETVTQEKQRTETSRETSPTIPAKLKIEQTSNDATKDVQTPRRKDLDSQLEDEVQRAVEMFSDIFKWLGGATQMFRRNR